MVDVAIKYEPAVIQEFAQRLYKQASGLVLAWAFRIGLLGLIVGAGLGSAMHSPAPSFVLAIVGGLMGAAYGREKGFELRLRAQEALCLLQTEINTRRNA